MATATTLLTLMGLTGIGRARAVRVFAACDPDPGLDQLQERILEKLSMMISMVDLQEAKDTADTIVSDEEIPGEVLGDENRIHPSPDRSKGFAPDRIGCPSGPPKGRRTDHWRVGAAGGREDGERDAVLKAIVRPRIEARLDDLVRDAERCVAIHEEHPDGALIAVTSRFNCHNDIYRLTQEISRCIVVDDLFTDSRKKDAERARDSLRAATNALAGMRTADAADRVREARQAFSDIWDGGGAEREATLNEVVGPRVDAKFESLVRTAEMCTRIHEEHPDDALIATTSRFCVHNDIYRLTQEISRYIVVDELFAGGRRKSATRSRDLLRAATNAMAGMRIADAADRVKEARQAFSGILDGTAERRARERTFGKRA